MCIITDKTSVSTTIGYAGITKKGRNIFAYQNDVQPVGNNPRAMVLHFNAWNDTPILVHDTTDYSNFLTKMKNRYSEMLDDGSYPLSLRGGKDRGISMLKVGMYDIAVVRNPTVASITEALDNFEQDKRPYFSEDLKMFYEKYLGTWSLLICSFDKAMSTQPLMVEYYGPVKISGERVTFFPALDNDTNGYHEGLPIFDYKQFGEKAKVNRDHLIFYGNAQDDKKVGNLCIDVEHDAPNELIAKNVGVCDFRGGYRTLNGDLYHYIDRNFFEHNGSVSYPAMGYTPQQMTS